MNPLFLFGLIFLIITLVVYPKLQKNVENPLCPSDIKGVSDNKKYFKIFLIISISMVVLGGILMLV